MAKGREMQCIHYVCEGNCDLGKEGTFRHKCQTCKTYKKKKGSQPARTDNRRRKNEKFEKRQLREQWK